MVNFERTEADFIKNTVRNMIQNVRVGHVVQVYEHAEDDDNSNFEVDVNFPGERDLEHRVAPLQGPHSNAIAVPKVGDKVAVEYLHGDEKNPVVRNIFYTNEDRAVKGEAGMWRMLMESGDSDAGSGDLYFTTHARYDDNPAINDYRDLNPSQSFVRIAKKEGAFDETGLPMSIEMFDDAENGDAYIKAEANKAGGVDSNASYGFKIDLSDGSFKILDKEGYGIVSDGNGNFTWYRQNINYVNGTTSL